ncbi:WIPF2 protein, partial [Eolophus roseicapillus]|nr:WIPF2 protein [Eolophus roseicapilla]
MPIPPPPPPGPPPPPTFSQANTEPPKLSREEQRGRGALLQDICKGTKLKKVTQINDRSAPILEKPKGSAGGGCSYSSNSAAIQPKGGLFQGGVPKLRPVGSKDSSDSSGKQTLQVPGSRAAAPRPPVPASNNRPQDDADNSRGSPPELPRTQRPSLPDSAPELPQRHNSLHRKAPGSLRGLAPLPPASASPSLQSSRPPPPARDPPSRGAAPPPPPPLLRNGGRDAPPPPPPYRLHGSTEPPSRGKPPPPPTRTPAGPPPPPPPVRNGHRDSISTVRAFLDDFESKYSFHPVEDFPAPEEYKYFQRIYPSKTNRATRGAPPLPPIPR